MKLWFRYEVILQLPVQWVQTTYLESADRDDFSDVSSESVHILVFMIDFFYGVYTLIVWNILM